LPTSIRHLQLQPGIQSDPIQCSFTFTVIDDGLRKSETRLPYEAVSYVWGDPSDTEPICCDGASLRVPTSLAGVLRRLRLIGRERVLWVDAGCIDQSSAEEKSEQVQIMGAIFQQAANVLFCLATEE
ncbi:HET-domain-containing protein, partial [Setomelanomma holmii]